MIAIYEPLYLSGQELVEPAFLPFRMESNTHADWREFSILVEMYRRDLHRQQRLTGLFSPKFKLKTGTEGAQFIDFVRANTDADVCFINPFPQLAYISFNVWMQGEESHPGLISRAQALLDVTGVKLRINDVPRHGPDLLCYCNFWVGTEQFWDDYVGGVLVPIAEYLENNPDDATSRAVLDQTTHTDPAPFLPFIIERLFSSYLSRPGNQIKSRGFLIDPMQSCLNEFERDIVHFRRSEIDNADRTGVFSDALKSNMALICRLWQSYNHAYYEGNPHPHSGKPLIKSVRG